MILDAIVAAKQRAHAERSPGAGFLSSLAEAPRRSLRAVIGKPLDVPRPHVIAEFKRRSPSAGALRPEGAREEQRTIPAAYQRAGASALSILTDEEFFGGRLADVADARRSSSLPILRKDFVLFEEDLDDALDVGADAVLLIVRLLDGPSLRRLLDRARKLGLDALVEIHAEAELAIALDAGADLVGVNHRDLDTLAVDLDLSLRLAERFPASIVRVAESGIRTAADLRAMHERGYHAALIGEALLREADPGAALVKLLSQ